MLSRTFETIVIFGTIMILNDFYPLDVFSFSTFSECIILCNKKVCFLISFHNHKSTTNSTKNRISLRIRNLVCDRV